MALNRFIRLFGAVAVLLSGCLSERAPAPVSVPIRIDTAAATYTQRVARIVNTNCAISGCHSQAARSAGLAMADYAGTRFAFSEAQALCSVRRQPGCKAMPAAGPLADSLVQVLALWELRGWPQ